ncbi:hypothetical protein MMC26_003284 [Xylographa opegraphella]|nr:hypothetical protein [Xylographa opegraphella]
MRELLYHSDALYDHQQPCSNANSSRIHLWNDWSLGICRPAATADEKAILRDPALKPVREPHRIAPAEAIKLVQQCLKTLQHNAQGQKYVGVIAPIDKITYPFDVFDHIDQALFSGVLKGNVFLKWEFLRRGTCGRTSRAGFAASPRISLGLSDDLQRGPPALILEALVHQMLHAYLIQCCGYREPNAEMNGHDLAHDLEYCTLAYLIQKFLRGQEIPRCSACLGYHIDICPAGRRRSMIKRLTGSHITGPGSSDCEANGENITLRSIQDYNRHVKKTTPVPSLKIHDRSPVDSNKVPRPLSQYFHIYSNNTGKAAAQLRTTFKTSGKCVEFHFQNRAFPVHLPQDTAPPSLSDKIKSNSVFQVSGDDEETFKRLLSFIETGEYKPSGCDRQPMAFSINLPGPPTIVEHNASSKSFILVDIKVYRLGMELDYLELKTLALRNLFHQDQTDEDPCAILEYIYHGGPLKEIKVDSKKLPIKHPDNALRDWVKAWLKVPCGSPFFDNLGILQKHPLWAEKYTKLRERGSELITDIDSIERELMQKRAYRYQASAAQKLTSRSYDSLPQPYQYLHQSRRSDGFQHLPELPTDASMFYDRQFYDRHPQQTYSCGRSPDGYDRVPLSSGTSWNPIPVPMADAATNYFLPPQAGRSYQSWD